MTDTTKRAEIYRKAAQRLERDEGSPYATDQIGAVCGHFVNGYAENHDRTIGRFAALQASYKDALGVESNFMFDKDQSILALCFVAAMVEAGDA